MACHRFGATPASTIWPTSCSSPARNASSATERSCEQFAAVMSRAIAATRMACMFHSSRSRTSGAMVKERVAPSASAMARTSETPMKFTAASTRVTCRLTPKNELLTTRRSRAVSAASRLTTADTANTPASGSASTFSSACTVMGGRGSASSPPMAARIAGSSTMPRSVLLRSMSIASMYVSHGLCRKRCTLRSRRSAVPLSTNSDKAMRIVAGERAVTVSNSAAPSNGGLPSSEMKTSVGAASSAVSASAAVVASTTCHSGRTVRSARRCISAT